MELRFVVRDFQRDIKKSKNLAIRLSENSDRQPQRLPYKHGLHRNVRNTRDGTHYRAILDFEFLIQSLPIKKLFKLEEERRRLMEQY